MGRPGAGGGGGGRSMGGHSASSRSVGGHRVGGSSSSRPMGGTSSRSGSGRGTPSGGGFNSSPMGGRRPPSGGGFNGAPWGGYAPHPAPMPRQPRPPRQGRRHRSGDVYGGGVSFLGTILAFIVIIVVFAAVALAAGVFKMGRGGSTPSSSYNREKLESGNGYINDCIYDELGWFENESRTEGRLKDFYEKTGVQPYIALLDTDRLGKTIDTDDDSALDAYALQWYEDNIDGESTFLYVYFGDDSDEIGYMCYVNGMQVSSVMDSEAVDIFWSYLDKYWYSDLSTDDMFVRTFNSTADKIMTKTTTGKDILKYVLIVVAAGVVVFGIIKVVRLKNQRAKEAAEETERILNTPMETLVEKELEETAKKYDEQSKQ